VGVQDAIEKLLIWKFDIRYDGLLELCWLLLQRLWLDELSCSTGKGVLCVNLHLYFIYAAKDCLEVILYSMFYTATVKCLMLCMWGFSYEILTW